MLSAGMVPFCADGHGQSTGFATVPESFVCQWKNMRKRRFPVFATGKSRGGDKKTKKIS